MPTETEMMDSSTFLPTCPICGRPVPLEDSKTDENGKAVHEECYEASLRHVV